MSTEFRFGDEWSQDNEWAFTRWGMGLRAGQSKGIAGFDFGSPMNLRNVMTRLDRGEIIFSERGEKVDFHGFMIMLQEARCTFGEFGGTVEIGSGEMFTRSGIETVEDMFK